MEGGIRCLSLRRVDKGSLVGFCELEVVAWSLIVRDCKWLKTEKGEFIAFPSSSYTTRDQKTVYRDLVEIIDKQKRERFQAAALAAVKAYRAPQQ